MPRSHQQLQSESIAPFHVHPPSSTTATVQNMFSGSLFGNKALQPKLRNFRSEYAHKWQILRRSDFLTGISCFHTLKTKNGQRILKWIRLFYMLLWPQCGNDGQPATLKNYYIITRLFSLGLPYYTGIFDTWPMFIRSYTLSQYKMTKCTKNRHIFLI